MEIDGTVSGADCSLDGLDVGPKVVNVKAGTVSSRRTDVAIKIY